MNRQQSDVFCNIKRVHYLEEATNKILCHALRWLFKHGDDDDDVQGAEGGKESEDEELNRFKYSQLQNYYC